MRWCSRIDRSCRRRLNSACDFSFSLSELWMLSCSSVQDSHDALLARLAEARDFDVSLVAGIRSSRNASSDTDWDTLCLDHGFEYVDTEDNTDDESGGQLPGPCLTLPEIFALITHSYQVYQEFHGFSRLCKPTYGLLQNRYLHLSSSTVNPCFARQTT
jgi:hypothetical protein